MFNSTTGRLHHLRVTWHSFASVYFVYLRNTVNRFPGTVKNRRRLPAAIAATPTPLHTPSVNARMPSEGLNGYRASTFGTRCREIIDPFDLLCPPRDSGVSLALSERLHLHVNFSSVSLHENCRGARKDGESTGGELRTRMESAQSR